MAETNKRRLKGSGGKRVGAGRPAVLAFYQRLAIGGRCDQLERQEQEKRAALELDAKLTSAGIIDRWKQNEELAIHNMPAEAKAAFLDAYSKLADEQKYPGEIQDRYAELTESGAFDEVDDAILDAIDRIYLNRLKLEEYRKARANEVAWVQSNGERIKFIIGRTGHTSRKSWKSKADTLRIKKQVIAEIMQQPSNSYDGLTPSQTPLALGIEGVSLRMVEECWREFKNYRAMAISRRE